MVFCRQFATMMQAGITVLQILKIQAQQSENPVLKERLREVVVEVERGGTLAGALGAQGKIFPQIIISLSLIHILQRNWLPRAFRHS